MELLFTCHTSLLCQLMDPSIVFVHKTNYIGLAVLASVQASYEWITYHLEAPSPSRSFSLRNTEKMLEIHTKRDRLSAPCLLYNAEWAIARSTSHRPGDAASQAPDLNFSPSETKQELARLAIRKLGADSTTTWAHCVNTCRGSVKLIAVTDHELSMPALQDNLGSFWGYLASHQLF